jgi:OOP family OmpA-OmpF porin
VNNTKKIALAAAILCSAGTALAQDSSEVINPSWYIAPTVVGIKPDHDFLTSKKDWGGGLKFGKAVHPLWDIQIGATQARVDDNGFNYRQTLVGVDALLMLSRKTFRPYLLIGVGGERDHESNPIRNASGWSPYYQAGLGFQVSMNEQWSLQADVRDVRAHLRDDDKFGFSRANTKYATFSLNYAFNPPPARFEKVTLSASELFAFDSATLSSPQPKLDDIAAALQADPSITDVDITGYTDRLGSTKYNQKLSERRANAVRNYLIAKGIDGGRLKAYGKGEQNPIVTDCHQKKRKELIECLAPNRRVEVEPITIERRVQ